MYHMTPSNHGQPTVMTSGYGPGPATRQIDLRSVLSVLWRRKGIFIICILLALAAAVGYRVLATKTYTAKARILIEPRGLQVMETDVSPQAAGGAESFAIVDSQRRVMTSDGVLKQVVDQEKLATDPEFGAAASGIIADLKAIFLGNPETTADLKLRALRKLRRAVGSSSPQSSYIIDLMVQTEDAAKSVRIAQAIATSYIDYEFAARSSTTSKVADALTDRLGRLRRQVKVAEDKATKFAQANNIVRTGDRLLSEQQMVQLSDRLAEARAQTSTARARFQQIEKLRKTNASIDAVAEAVQSPAVTQLRARLTLAQQNAATMAQSLSDRHPSMIAAKSQIASIRGQIRSELARIVKSAKADLERAVRNETELNNKLVEETAENSMVNQKLVQLRELERDVQASRTVYEAFLVRAREVGQLSSFNPTVARILSPPTEPERPDGPSFVILAALALLAGTIVGAVIVYLRETLSASQPEPVMIDVVAEDVNTLAPPPAATTIHVRQDMLAGLPVLANADMSQADGRLAHSNISLIDDPVTRAVVYHQPASAAAMAFTDLYRTLRGHQPGLRSVLVTSHGDDTSKAPVALNLALAASAAGERVLLIDADLTNATLTRAARLAPRPSLPEVMAGKVKLSSALIAIDGLAISMLGASSVAGHQTVQPHPMAIKRGILEQARQFDFIVIAGPAIGADVWFDAFAHSTDEVIVAVDQMAPANDQLMGDLARLENSGHGARGVVMTA